MTSRRNKSCPKLLCRKTVMCLTLSTVFWSAIPNFELVLLTFEMLSKFFSLVTGVLQAMQVRSSGFQDVEFSKLFSATIREIIRWYFPMFVCQIFRGKQLRKWPILLQLLLRSCLLRFLCPAIFRIFLLFFVLESTQSFLEFAPGLEVWERILFILEDVLFQYTNKVS